VYVIPIETFNYNTITTLLLCYYPLILDMKSIKMTAIYRKKTVDPLTYMNLSIVVY